LLVVMPELARFAEVEARLSAAFLDGVRGALQGRYVNLGFPRFQVEQTLPLATPLRALGMEAAFTGSADLSGMTQAERLLIEDVDTKAVLFLGRVVKP
jgi:serpin B